MAEPRVLIIVPAFDEAASIARVIADVRAQARAMDVLVVDDGSTDETAANAARAGATVVRLPFNLGVGAAMQTGFLFATRHGYDIAVQVDGDGQHPASEVSRLVEPIARGEADAVIGSRYLDDRGYVTPAGRRAGQRFFSWLVGRLTRARFTDTTSGFRAYGRDAFEFLSRSYSRDYPEVNALVALSQRGYRLREIPVAMFDRQAGASHITLPRALFYMMKVPLAAVMTAARRPRRLVDTRRAG